MSASSKTDFESFMELFDCPIDLEPLKTAVSLIPCMHKINQVSAEALYGTIGLVCTKQRPCCICGQTVTGYQIDHKIREIVINIVSKVDDEKKSIVFSSPKKDKTKEDEKPYPWVPAKFALMQHYGGDWSCKDGRSEWCRKMHFVSLKSNSFIRTLKFTGNKTGEKLHLQISFYASLHIAEEFITSCGVKTKLFGLNLNISTKEEIRMMFEIITKNNEFMELEKLELLKKIINVFSAS